MRKDFLSLPTNASDPDPACLALLLRNKEYSQQHLKEKMNSKMKRMDVLCSTVQTEAGTYPSLHVLSNFIHPFAQGIVELWDMVGAGYT